MKIIARIIYEFILSLYAVILIVVFAGVGIKFIIDQGKMVEVGIVLILVSIYFTYWRIKSLSLLALSIKNYLKKTMKKS